MTTERKWISSSLVNSSLIVLARTSKVKKITIDNDRNMTVNRQSVLNHFKQGHILEIYQELTSDQKDELTEQLEKIPFDLIDMVNLFVDQPTKIQIFKTNICFKTN